MTRAGFPYIKPESGLVRADVWLLHNGVDFGPAPLYVPGWDYNTTLTFRREIEVDVGAVKDASGLGAEARLAVTVGAFSTASWVRAEAFRHELEIGSGRVSAEFELHGEELGGNLKLRTALVLHHGAHPAPYIARFPGSILWDDVFEMRLQGDAPLFPISVVDFGRAGFAPGAGWYLQIGSDLAAPLHASLRLYLSSTNRAVVMAFQNAGAPRPEDQVLFQAVRADVARIMVEHSLNQEDLHKEQDWDPESLGFALKNLLDRFYPGENLEQVSLRRINHPADFSAELFAQIRVFDGD